MNQAKKALIITLSVAVLLACGLVIADVISRSSAQKSAQQALLSVNGLQPEGLRVQAKGEPFVPQVLTGKLKQVQAQADTVHFSVESTALQLEQLEVELKGLSTKLPYVADSMKVQALLPAQSVQALVHAKGFLMDANCKQSYIDLSSELNGLPVVVSVKAEPSTQNASDLTHVVPALKFVPSTITLNVENMSSVLAQSSSGVNSTKTQDKDKKKPEPSSFDLGSMLRKFQLPTFSLALEHVPEGLQISSIDILPEGVKFTLEGTNINLSAAAKPKAPQFASQQPSPRSVPQTSQHK